MSVSRSETSSSSLLWVHLARFLSVVGVIAIHVAYPLTTKWGEISTKWWLIAEAANSLGRFSVPLFFALSGYLLLQRPEPIGDFFRKRFEKVLLPLLAWSLIYVLWAAWWGERQFNLFSAFASILSGPVADHLWFLYALVGVYLAVPLLWKFIEGDSNRLLVYFLFLWVLFVPLKNIFGVLFGFEFGFDFPLAGGFVGYFLLGFWLGRRTFGPRWRVLALLVFLLCVALAVYGNFARSLAAGQFDNFFDNYFGLLVFLETTALLIFLPGLEPSLRRLPGLAQKILVGLGLISYGVYLVHMLLIEAFRRGYFGFSMSATALHPLYGIPVTIVLVFLVSLLVTLIFRALPVLRKIVP